MGYGRFKQKILPLRVPALSMPRCARLSGELIPFASQGGGDVHPATIEQNRNFVNANSEFPEAGRMQEPQPKPPATDQYSSRLRSV